MSIEQLVGVRSLVLRVVLLAATVAAVILLTWTSVHRPYILEQSRSTDIAVAKAVAAVERAERVSKAASEQSDRFTAKANAIGKRLDHVISGYSAILERLDAIDSRLYRMERLPGVLGE